MMKKLFYILMFSLFITGCAGTSDWSYELPNGYEVWKISSQDIIIKDTNTGNNVYEISGFVKEFSHDSRFVFTRNVENILENNIMNELYYVLDTMKNKVYGPFCSVDDLKNQVKELKTDIPSKWYRTSPDPNM